MRVNAYVLAADPTWIENSISAYYHHVDRIVVSYDRSHRGWTGAPIRSREALHLITSLDTEKKVELLSGDYSRLGSDPMRSETRQRQEALDAAGRDADWVLQLDTDEVIPRADQLLSVLEAAPADVRSVDWPMRVLYRKLGADRYLEVCGSQGEAFFEYPGPVAARAGAHLVEARRAEGPWLRPVMPGDTTSTQVARSVTKGEVRTPLPREAEAIWHNSWARSPINVLRKVRAWGHNQGLRTYRYYAVTWLPSPVTWRRLRDVHPVIESTWPNLRITRL